MTTSEKHRDSTRARPPQRGRYDWVLGLILACLIAGLVQALTGERILAGLVVLFALIVMAPVWSPVVLMALLTIAAFVSVPAPLLVVIPVEGLVVRPYELILIAAVVCVLVQERRRPYVDRRIIVFGVAVLGAIGLGLAGAHSVFRIFGDIRYVIYMLGAFLVFSTVAHVPSRSRVLGRVLLWVLWISAVSSILVSTGAATFGRRERSASLESDAVGAAARLLSPATYPSLAALCGLLALVSLARISTRTALMYAIPAAVVVALSFSRNSFLGLAGALLFALIAAACAGVIWRPIMIAAGITGGLVAAVLLATAVFRSTGIGVWLELQVSSFNERVLGGLTESGLANDGSAQFRFQQEDYYLEQQIANSPLIGHGMGYPYKPLLTGRTFGDKSEYLRYYAHNTYLWLWVKSGVFGLLAFVYAFATPIFGALWTRGDVAVAAGAATAGLLSCGFVVPMPLGTPTAVLLGAVAGLCAGAVADDREAAADGLDRRKEEASS